MKPGTGRVVISAGSLLLVAACAAPGSPQPHAVTSSPTTNKPTAIATSAPSTITPCVGLPSCAPPPPDAEGNPACYYRAGWAANPSGDGITVSYFREPSEAANGEEVTADIRLKNGTASQIAVIAPGQSSDQIKFPGIDVSSVQAVLLTTSAGRCYVADTSLTVPR